jgi:hypothetical protein
VSVDPDAARRAAEEILSRPEYREPQPSLADRVIEVIAEALGRIIGLAGGGPGNLIGAVVIAALLALAGWVLLRTIGAPGARRRRADRTRPTLGTSAPDDPAVWAAEADRLAREGDHRGALRCRYQELVAHLVRDRAVEDDPSRTPAELRDQLSAQRPELAAALRDVTGQFEEVWYGAAAVDAAGYTSFATTATAVREAAARPLHGASA